MKIINIVLDPSLRQRFTKKNVKNEWKEKFVLKYFFGDSKCFKPMLFFNIFSQWKIDPSLTPPPPPFSGKFN